MEKDIKEVKYFPEQELNALDDGCASHLVPARIHLIAFNYNSIDFVDGFFKSINDQILDRFDLTIINLKGSDDGSWERIKGWKPRPGIVLRLSKDMFSNHFMALNNAAMITLSRNKEAYLCPVNISDRLTRSALKLMWWHSMSAPKVDVFYPNFKIVDDKDHKNIIGYQNWPEYSHKALLKENFCGCSPLIKGSTFIEANSYDENLMYTSDYDLFLRLALDGKEFKLIEEVIGSHYEGETPTLMLKIYNEETEYIQQMHTPLGYE